MKGIVQRMPSAHISLVYLLMDSLPHGCVARVQSTRIQGSTGTADQLTKGMSDNTHKRAAGSSQRSLRRLG